MIVSGSISRVLRLYLPENTTRQIVRLGCHLSYIPFRRQYPVNTDPEGVFLERVGTDL